MQILKIHWQRLVQEEQTCERCAATEAEVDQAGQTLSRSLAPLGIEVVVEKQVLSQADFLKNPQQSNLIIINGRPLEYWLWGRTGRSPCCGPCGDQPCRTVEVQGQVYETIPATLIIQAGLMAAQQSLNPPSCSCTCNLPGRS